MRDEQSFLNEILANPIDDAPRLIYADWLEDQGSARSEFIRVQCELEHSPVDSPRHVELRSREDALLARYLTVWADAFLPLGIHPNAIRFRRGFVNAIGIESRQCGAHLGTIRKLAPLLGRLYIHRAADHWDSIVRSPHLGNLLQLGCTMTELTAEMVEGLLQRDDLASLVALDFSNSNIGDGGLEAIANAQHLRNLIAIDLSHCNLSWRGVRALLKSQLATRIEWLNLSSNSIDERGFRLLLKTSSMPNMKKLQLDGRRVDYEIKARVKMAWKEVVTFSELAHKTE